MITEIKTFRLRCDEIGCGAFEIAHAQDESGAIASSGFVVEGLALHCPQHRIY